MPIRFSRRRSIRNRDFGAGRAAWGCVSSLWSGRRKTRSTLFLTSEQRTAAKLSRLSWKTNFVSQSGWNSAGRIRGRCIAASTRMAAARTQAPDQGILPRSDAKLVRSSPTRSVPCHMVYQVNREEITETASDSTNALVRFGVPRQDEAGSPTRPQRQVRRLRSAGPPARLDADGG